MSSFLPSEISRLVLGYLEEVKCKHAYQAFMEECPHLAECRGRGFFTRIMGYTLVEMLDDFCAVQTYLIGKSHGDEFKKKVLRCTSLLEKVRLFVEEDGKPTTTVLKCHRHTSPMKPSQQSYSVHRTNRVRSNSCDSVLSIRTDASECAMARPLDSRRMGGHTRSVESLAEATNLADLPGNKRYSIGCQTKPYSNNTNSYRNQSYRDGPGGKPFDTKYSRTHGKYESDEETFRSALGLVRHSDLPDSRHFKTPMKGAGKTMSRKQGMSVKKHVPDPIPNETLDVTTITHALLDCTEFHEKLAENINKIYSNLSINKSGEELTLPTSQKLESIVKEHMTGVMETNHDEPSPEEIPQLDNVIKSIVEKTEKDPIFDQLVTEVLAASVESSSGSDSDIVSQPGTSTPEKYSGSQMNESSPTHTWKGKDMADYPIDKHSRSFFGSKKLQATYREKMRSRRMSPFKHNSYNQFYSRNRKHQRYPRGGKRMDILRETYGSSFCENDDEDDSPTPGDKPEPKNQASNVVTQPKPEPKVVILSDEIVSAHPKTLLLDTLQQGKELPHIVSVSRPEETIIKPCKNSIGGVSVEANSLDPRLQNRNKLIDKNQPIVLKTVSGYEDSATNGALLNSVKLSDKPIALKTGQGIDDNVVSGASTNPVKLPIGEQAKNVAVLEVLPQVVNNVTTSDSSVSSHTNSVVNSQCNLRRFRKNVHPKHKTEMIDRDKPFYSEADIMKMPTVFVETPNNLEGVQTLDPPISIQEPAPPSVETVISIPPTKAVVAPIIQPSTANPNVQNSKLLYRERVPLMSVHKLISSMVQDTNGTHILQIDGNLVDAKAKNGGSTVPTQAEVVLATKIEQPKENRNKPEVINLLDSQDKDKDNGVDQSDTKSIAESQKSDAGTPRRSLSHVRVLDFNTPPKCLTEARKAFSSPKMSTRSMTKESHKPFLTPSTSTRPKSKSIKSKLFPAISENPEEDFKNMASSNNDSVKVEVIASGVWDEVHGVGQILKKSDAANSNIPIEDVVKSVNEIVNVKEKTPEDKDDKKIANPKKKVKVLKPVEKQPEPIKKEISDKELEEQAAAMEWARIRNANKKSWDQEMRLMLSSKATPVREIFSKKKKRKITLHKPSSLDESDEMSKSLEDEAKLLEDALNKTTGLTPAKSLSKSKLKSLEVIDEDKDNHHDDEDQGDEIMHSENNSCQSDFKPEEVNGVNNKDYLLHVKLFRDSMKSTQQAEMCKFVTYSKPQSPCIQNTVKKPRRTPKVKGTFKVKFSSKNSKEVHDSDSGENEIINVVDDDSNKDPVAKVNTTQEMEAVVHELHEEVVEMKTVEVISTKKTLPAATEIVLPEKNEVLLTPVEPPVPSIKITPDIPREHDFNPLNAKCNLNNILETPFKFDLLDLHMDTPKFISPGFFNASLSGVKISDIPTPSFAFLSGLSQTPNSNVKEPTPGSYSSRPTDYSSSSSYYKPDEIELNLDVKAKMKAIKTSPNKLPVLKEESESPQEEVSTRVLRPRRSRTVYYPEANNRSRNDSLEKSNDSINRSKSKTPLKENIPKVPSKVNILPKTPVNKLSSLESSTKKSATKFHEDLCMSSSSSSFEEFMDDDKVTLSNLIKSTSTPNSNSEKKIPEVSKKYLEEKRNRVLTKLKKAPSNKKPSRPKTKVSIKGKRVTNKLSITRKSISPKRNVVKFDDSLNKSKLDDEKVEVAQEEVKIVKIDEEKEQKPSPQVIVKAVASKSRRKSSTPRKLLQSEIESIMSPAESASDGDQHIDLRNNLPTKGVVETKSTTVAENVSAYKDESVENKTDKSQVDMDLSETHGKIHEESKQEDMVISENVFEKANINTNIELGDDYVTLHLSSDELDVDPPIKSAIPVLPAVTNDSYDITQIKEFLACTDNKKVDTSFKENLLKQGFDNISAEAIERELIGSTSSDVFEISENKTTLEPEMKDVIKDDNGSIKNANEFVSDSKKKEIESDSKSVLHNKSDNKSSKHSSKHHSKDRDRKSSKERHNSNSPHRSRSHSHSSHKTSSKSSSSDHKNRDRKKSDDKKDDKDRKRSEKHKESEKSTKMENKSRDKKKGDGDGKSSEDSNIKTSSIDKKDNIKTSSIDKKDSIKISSIDKKDSIESKTSCIDKKANEKSLKEPVCSLVKDLDILHDEPKMESENTSVNKDVMEKTSEKMDVDSCETADQEEEEDIVVWSNYDCLSSSTNFICCEYVPSKSRKKPVKVMDVSRLKIKVSVFNSLSETEEVRDLKISNHKELLEIPPDKVKLRRIRRREHKLKKETLDPKRGKVNKKAAMLAALFDDCTNTSESQSSCRSMEEVQDSKEEIPEIHNHIKSIVTDDAASHADLFTNNLKSKKDVDPQHPIKSDSPKNDTSTEDELLQKVAEVSTENYSQDSSVEATSKEKVSEELEDPEVDTSKETSKNSELTSENDSPSKDDLMNFAVLRNADDEKAFKGVETVEKRKREDCDDDSSSKKNKLSSPQSLLMKLDIDAVLSKLHGPESTK